MRKGSCLSRTGEKYEPPCGTNVCRCQLHGIHRSPANDTEADPLGLPRLVSRYEMFSVVLGADMSHGGRCVFSTRDFWIELKARVNGRSVEEEEEEIRRVRREGRTVMLRVKRYGEALSVPKGTSGCR